MTTRQNARESWGRGKDNRKSDPPRRRGERGRRPKRKKDNKYQGEEVPSEWQAEGGDIESLLAGRIGPPRANQALVPKKKRPLKGWVAGSGTRKSLIPKKRADVQTTGGGGVDFSERVP